MASPRISANVPPETVWVISPRGLYKRVPVIHNVQGPVQRDPEYGYLVTPKAHAEGFRLADPALRGECTREQYASLLAFMAACDARSKAGPRKTKEWYEQFGPRHPIANVPLSALCDYAREKLGDAEDYLVPAVEPEPEGNEDYLVPAVEPEPEGNEDE